MAHRDKFTFNIYPEERRLLKLLAAKLQRTQSDTIRWMIRRAASGFVQVSDGMQFAPSAEEEPLHE